MALYYSASAHGFFDDQLHDADAIPTDARRISTTQHHRLLSAQAEGGMITADANGRPRIAQRSVADRRMAAVRAVKRETRRRIEAVSPVWRQLNDQRHPTSEGQARFAAVDALRAASDAIEADVANLDAAALDQLTVAAHPLWPAE